MFNLPNILHKNPESEPSFLVLDLGSSYIKAAVFSRLSETKLSLLGYSRQFQAENAVREGMLIDIAAVAGRAEEVIEEVSVAAGLKPEKVIIGLSGAAVQEFLTQIKITREAPESILEESELSKISQKVREASFLEVEKELTDISGSTQLEAEIVDSRLSNFKVDGYDLEEPLGFTGKVLEISLRNTVAPRVYLERLRALLKLLKISEYRCIGQLSALTRVIAGPDKKINTLLADIGGEKTDIAVVFGGQLIGSRSWGVGGSHLTQLIRDRLMVSYSEAETEKISYLQGQPAGEHLPAVKDAVHAFISLWLAGLETALSDFSGVKTFPNRFVLSGGGSILPELSGRLAAFPWTSILPFRDCPKIIPVSLSSTDSFLENHSSHILGDWDLLPLALGFTGLQENRERSSVDAFFRT
ncbi:MAG: cell division FtsA domain-containing protein [Patescibacteria group bacterium]